MKRLTPRRLKEVLLYDPESGVFTWRVAQGAAAEGDIAGGLSGAGYWVIGIDGQDYQAHRLAILYVTGEWPGPHVDHKNRHPLDNRIGNLRSGTCSENLQNVFEPQSNNSHGWRGIWLHAGRWRAGICIGRKKISLGRYDDPEAAYLAHLVGKVMFHPAANFENTRSLL